MTAGANIFTVPKLRDNGAALGQISFISGMVCVLVMGLFYGFLLLAALGGCIFALCSVLLYEWSRRTVVDRNFFGGLAGEVPAAVCEVGPYQYTRHPFYLSYIVAFVGVAVALPSLIVAGVCLLNVGLFVYMAFDDERVLLGSALGANYKSYKMRVGMFYLESQGSDKHRECSMMFLPKRVYQGAAMARTFSRYAGTVVMVLLSSHTMAAGKDAGCAAELKVTPIHKQVPIIHDHLLDVHFFRVTIHNVGTESLLLVQPGDGSGSNLRTPYVSWEVHNLSGLVSQKYVALEDDGINAVASNELIRLSPKASVELSGWIPPLVVDGPGIYRIRIRYVNNPDEKWRGKPLGKHDPEALRLIKLSNACDLTSDAVEIEAVADTKASARQSN